VVTENDSVCGYVVEILVEKLMSLQSARLVCRKLS
jgi:hypothetical protein